LRISSTLAQAYQRCKIALLFQEQYFGASLIALELLNSIVTENTFPSAKNFQILGTS
jgi:hypothetical protein